MIPFLRRFKGLNRVLPGLVASASVLALMKLQVWAPLERAINTQMMRWRGSGPWDSRIVMISVDDKTLGELGQFPISRDYYAELLWLLAREETSVVVFNLLLSDDMAAGSDLETSSAANARLAGAMSAHGRVAIGQTWGNEGEAIEPVPVLAETALANGHLRLKVDPDGLTRWVEVTVEDIPALGIAAVQAYSLEEELIGIPSDVALLQINWPGSARDLATLSLVDVLNGQFPPSYLAGKIVVVGYGATTGRAQLRTPFDNREPVPGGYMHAAVIDNLLQQRWLRSVPSNTVAIFLLSGGCLLGGLLYRRAVPIQLVAGTALAVLWLLACAIALNFSYLLPVVPPLVTIALTGTYVGILGRLQSNALLQVRSAFLNTMSHEIRTPLNAIVNLSEMLQDTPLDDRQREFAETLHSSSQTLLALINDVLDFSKIESGRLMLEEYPVRLGETIERSIELLAPRAAEKELELVYAIAPGTPAAVMSDPVRLQQILINLLSNAVKFTDVGQVSVRVSAMALSQQEALFSLRRLSLNHWLRAQLGLWQKRQRPLPVPAAANLYEIRFAVSDTGIGIPPERISQLFKPFSQVSASTTRKYGGTGLGLSISKRLSERMGGDLWVKSYPGRGSTFSFTVQAQLAEAEAALPDYLAGLSGTRLLLVDGNETRREQLVWELEPIGISLARANSLSEARAFMQSDPSFEGIVLDEAVATSTEECLQSIATLRTIAHNRSLPVILLSALKSSPQQLPDNTTILWKPIRQASLRQALRVIRPFASVPPAIAPIERAAKTSLESSPQVELSILIAEDNRINQRVALRLLELLGYQADIASSGEEAIATLKRQPYDVILMDMRMPGQDGIETTRQIRQMPQHKDTWIIAMTANAMSKDRQRCFAAGMDDYLSKPINRKALALALQRCPASQQQLALSQQKLSS